MLQLFNILSDKRSRSHVRDYRDWDNGYVPDIGILLIHSAEEIYAGFRDRDEPEGCFRKTKAGLDIRIVDIVQITLAPSKNYHSEICCNCFFERNPREMTRPDKSTFRLTAFLTERVVYRWNFCKENASFANLNTSSISDLID